jgi:hypothetical protein
MSQSEDDLIETTCRRCGNDLVGDEETLCRECRIFTDGLDDLPSDSDEETFDRPPLNLPLGKRISVPVKRMPR